jgi:hypothetical protein
LGACRGDLAMPRFIETDTYIEPEERAYNTPTGTHWRSNRKARVLCADGKRRIVTIGIPSSYFTIPGHDSRGRVGFVSVEETASGPAFVWTPRK